MKNKNKKYKNEQNFTKILGGKKNSVSRKTKWNKKVKLKVDKTFQWKMWGEGARETKIGRNKSSKQLEIGAYKWKVEGEEAAQRTQKMKKAYKKEEARVGKKMEEE